MVEVARALRAQSALRQPIALPHDDGTYRDYEQGYDQGYDVGQHVSLCGAQDEDAGPDPGGPMHDSWHDDGEDGEDAESHDAWFESHYDRSEWGDSEA